MSELPDHLMASDCGDLFDTRGANWSKLPPLRKAYQYGFTRIRTVAELKATLRHGPYAWPGGYPLYFVTDDGEALSFDSVRKEWRTILNNWDSPRSGWRVTACAINYEDSELLCSHSGKRIESAYSED